MRVVLLRSGRLKPAGGDVLRGIQRVGADVVTAVASTIEALPRAAGLPLIKFLDRLPLMLIK
jgi:hypothetical protein